MISLLDNSRSLRSQRNLKKTHEAVAKSTNRLSSGLRINRAGDDAARSSSSSKFTAYGQGLKQAERNGNDAMSWLQTMEGGLTQIRDCLTRMRELAVQASNEGTMDSTERSYLDQEYNILEEEIERIEDVTEYNGHKLSDTGTFKVQIGAKNTSANQIEISRPSTFTNLPISPSPSIHIGTVTKARAQITLVDDTIKMLNDELSTLGATQNRIQSTLSNLGQSHTNSEASNSRLKDVDVAQETATLTRNQIRAQAASSVLAQANQLPQTALRLIG